MLFSDQKLDANFSRGTCRPENKSEMEAMQRQYPPDLPGTHTWDYRWVQPTPDELARNRYTLPHLDFGPRELALSEIADKTHNFDDLPLPALRHLVEKYHAKTPPLVEGKPPMPELDALRAAIQDYCKANGDKPLPSIQAKAKAKSSIVLPPDVATMNDGQLEKEAARIGCLHEYAKIAGKSLPIRREFIAGERAKKAEPVEA